MHRLPTVSLHLLALLAMAAGPASGQDGFGSAVTVTDEGEVVVLKPGAAVGPASATVFHRSGDGAWAPVATLTKLPGGLPGETLTPLVSAGGDLLLLGSGDPDGSEAGHLYRRSDGAWSGVSRVPLDPRAAPAGGGLSPSGLDMATLTRLMGPPSRSIALSPDGSRLAVAGGALPTGTIHLLRNDAGSWVVDDVVQVDAETAQRGVSLALGERRLLVGVPGTRPGGAVHFFQDTADGWSRIASVVADSSEAGADLGFAVVLGASGDEAFASAPGRGMVVGLVRGSGEGWARTTLLAPSEGDPAATAGFGATLALHGKDLLVGAPRADAGRGRVFAFSRTPSGWSTDGVLTPGDLDRARFGSALALRDGRAVIGAPGADGADGRVAVVDLDSRDDLVWLEPGEPLESVAEAEPVRCADGQAAGFACESVDLVAFLSLSALGAEPGEGLTDIWGWTDPETGREYVLAGRTAGLAFIDITDPAAPRLVGLMPANPSHARDIKVYRDHAFMTGDGAGDHGLLIFDLTRLRGVVGAPATFQPDARYDLVASAHNLIIDTESGFAYTVGTNTGGQSCGGGLHMIDIRDPLNPSFAGCYTDSEGLIWTGRTHDAQCTVYRGPDENYHGRQICFAANETAMRIVDVTDKSAPLPISTASHPGTAYVHQGWLTEDHRYLYVNDELDEIVGTTDRTRTLIYDVAELDDPILVAVHLGPDQATDHNLYIDGDRAYLANYQAGLRVLDISDPENPVEVGWFDTTPYGENPPGFGGGAWTAWPFFDSGLVVVSSMNEGLFIVRPQRPVM